jgi:hypothetical protein
MTFESSFVWYRASTTSPGGGVGGVGAGDGGAGVGLGGMQDLSVPVVKAQVVPAFATRNTSEQKCTR